MQLPPFFENNKKLILIIVIGVLLIGNTYFITRCISGQIEVAEAKEQLENQKADRAVLNFLKLFIDKVLKATGEVSFDDRLKLENAVRDLQNEEILAQWEKFTGAKTETEVQVEVRSLLELLVRKVMY